MTDTTAAPAVASPSQHVGPLLRHWRSIRGKSQLALSLDAGISQRHISFIESGRSVPSRRALLDIGVALDIPLRERNALLLAAGYAPVYAEGPWNAPEMESVTRALERMLRQHEPFPALVIDRYWNVLMTNEAAPRFFNCFIDMSARKGPRNILHLLLDPDGMRPHVIGWERVARSLVERVRREAVGRVIDSKTEELLAVLSCRVDSERAAQEAVETRDAPAFPVIPIGFRYRGAVLNYFSMVTTVGTPQTIAGEELRLECMFPLDDDTERRHSELMR